MKKIDEVITDEQISAISNIDNLNVFIPSFFAALSSKNGLEGLKRLAKYKKLIGPVSLEIKEFEEKKMKDKYKTSDATFGIIYIKKLKD